MFFAGCKRNRHYSFLGGGDGGGGGFTFVGGGGFEFAPLFIPR